MGQVAERNDFLTKTPLILGLNSPAVTFEAEPLHVLPADVPLLGDHLCGAVLSDLLVSIARMPPFRSGEGIGKSERCRRGHTVGDRNLAHILYAASDNNIRRTAHDRL